MRRPERATTTRPPQFVVVSFDGAGGAPLWSYWRSVGQRAHARFTFFVSGVYLLDWNRHLLYRPPRHARGESEIGFAPDRAFVRGTLRQIALGYREGHEIGTHYDGHFCAPFTGSVGAWDAGDWSSELDQFDRLLFDASADEHLRPPVRLPFGRSEIVGARTPCLQGDLRVLYPVLARRGFRYDASAVAPLGAWPTRVDGLWSVPLPELPFPGHTYRVVSMDYNLFANQTAAVSGPPTEARSIEDEAYRTFWNAFSSVYRGGRAPLQVGYHFETWNHWAYDHALTRFLVRACGMPDVRCTTIETLVDWLDAQPPARLRRFRAGRFAHRSL